MHRDFLWRYLSSNYPTQVLLAYLKECPASVVAVLLSLRV